jgi:hypothetical protein
MNHRPFHAISLVCAQVFILVLVTAPLVFFALLLAEWLS